MPPIQQDGATDIEYSSDDAADAFSKLWKLDAPNEPSEDDKEKKQETAEDETPNDDVEANDATETSEETPEGEEGDEGDDESEGEDEGKQPTVEIKDDHQFEVTVDGQQIKKSLGELKRLAGQEAALTRKSQEVATQRKSIGEQSAVLLAQQQALLDRAKKRYEPYANLDLLAASKNPNISAEELVAVRNAAQAAYDDVKYLETETSRVAEALREQARKELMEQAQESLKTLSDPEKGIEGFNQQVYGDICTFAVEQGLPAEIVNDLVNPAAIKLINMARLYAKGQKAVQTAKPDKKKAPKRIVKGTASAETTKKVTTTAKSAEPMKRLQKSGAVEDAADAFMARWNRPSED